MSTSRSAAPKASTLKKRYGHAASIDEADLKIAREGLRELNERPESAVPLEEVKRVYGIR